MNNNSGCLLFFLKLFNKTNSEKQIELPYESQKWILTKAELSFFHCLQMAISPQDHTIFCKVRLEDIIRVKKGTTEYQSARNKIKSRHIDFVICDAKTSEIQRLIELNDPSHKNTDRMERDNFINEAFKKAGLTLITINTQKTYNIEEIRKLFS